VDYNELTDGEMHECPGSVRSYHEHISVWNDGRLIIHVHIGPWLEHEVTSKILLSR
jgi:hypothetical protein